MPLELLLRPIIPHLSRRFEERYGQPHQLTGLSGLPDELILAIVDFLDDEDVASVSLCNRSLHQVLYRPSWPSLSRKPDGTVSDKTTQFLRTLARDQPRVFYCHDCSLLHATRRLNPPGVAPWSWADVLDCVATTTAADPPASASHPTKITFSISRFLTSRRSWSGIDMAANTAWQLSKKKLNHDRDNRTALLSVDPMVLNDKLCLRHPAVENLPRR